MVYLSEVNDIVGIKLILIPDGTFDFYMNTYQESKQGIEPESEIINGNGIWHGDKKTIILKFDEKKKMELGYSPNKLNILGINCYNSKK